MLHSSIVSTLVLPPVIQQEHDGRQNRHRVHHNYRHLRRHVQRLVFVAESERAEDIAY